MANSLNDLLASLDDSLSMEKSAQAQPAFADLDMDALIKLAEDEGERAAAEMAAADDARLTDADKDLARADQDESEEEDDADEADKKLAEAKQDEKNMDKQAFLKKLAEIIVDDNGPEEENLAVGPTDEMVDADDAKVMPTPGLSEGAGNLVQAIMAQADEAANQSGAGVEVGDGDEMAEPEEDQVTKAAALDSLMDAGFSFDEAADMVKAASAAVSEQYTDMDKAAAVGELMGQGVDFDTAVEWVKEAAVKPVRKVKAPKTGAAKPEFKDAESSMADKMKGAFAAQKSKMSQAAGKTQDAFAKAKGAAAKAQKATVDAFGKAKNLAVKNPKTAIALGALGAAGALGGAGYGVHRKMSKQAEYTDMDKAAAVGYLMDQGVDFDTAVQAVVEAAE